MVCREDTHTSPTGTFRVLGAEEADGPEHQMPSSGQDIPQDTLVLS